MPLFVVLADGVDLDEALTARIKGAVRESLSQRHVPDAIVAVPAVPRTLTGKKMEVPVKRILLGRPLAEVAAPGAVSDPHALEFFVDYGANLGRHAGGSPV
jgi:acetoacetyl-CoA synthetase